MPAERTPRTHLSHPQSSGTQPSRSQPSGSQPSILRTSGSRPSQSRPSGSRGSRQRVEALAASPRSVTSTRDSDGIKEILESVDPNGGRCILTREIEGVRALLPLISHMYVRNHQRVLR